MFQYYFYHSIVFLFISKIRLDETLPLIFFLIDLLYLDKIFIVFDFFPIKYGIKIYLTFDLLVFY